MGSRLRIYQPRPLLPRVFSNLSALVKYFFFANNCFRPALFTVISAVINAYSYPTHPHITIHIHNRNTLRKPRKERMRKWLTKRGCWKELTLNISGTRLRSTEKHRQLTLVLCPLRSKLLCLSKNPSLRRQH